MKTRHAVNARPKSRTYNERSLQGDERTLNVARRAIMKPLITSHLRPYRLYRLYFIFPSWRSVQLRVIRIARDNRVDMFLLLQQKVVAKYSQFANSRR